MQVSAPSSRRSFLIGASAATMSGYAFPAQSATQALTVASRQLEVPWRSATVDRVTDLAGQPGFAAQQSGKLLRSNMNVAAQQLRDMAGLAGYFTYLHHATFGH